MNTISLSPCNLQSRTHLGSAASCTRARLCSVAPPRARVVTVEAGNSNENGIFAPIVRKVRDIVGKKPFNQLRGKGIALHSQVITYFCKEVGADPKTRQRLILTAKKNGGELGFLA